MPGRPHLQPHTCRRRPAVNRVNDRSTGPPAWDIQPGQTLNHRGEIGRSGGNQTHFVGAGADFLIFTDVADGHSLGFVDGWLDPGLFVATGTTQHPVGSELGLLSHQRRRAAVRLFKGVHGPVTYLGEFALDPTTPYDTLTVHPRDREPELRCRYRLHPVGTVHFDPADVLHHTIEGLPEALARQREALRELSLVHENLEAILGGKG